MEARVNRQWRLAARPDGMLKKTDFALREESVPSLVEGQMLLRNIYLSLDPTNRMWVNETATYLPPVQIGEVMRGGTIGVVEASRNAQYPEGSIVQGMIGWQEYAVTNGEGLTILPDLPGMPLDAHMGLFGHIGMTAYFGLLDVGQLKEGETLVVSAAAGAVGSLVGQIGKIYGCRVIGIAGTDEKCAWITKDLGFDAAINYKTESVPKRLRELCPDGIDVYFDNVGGEILDAALRFINLRARIVICGLISQYNEKKPAPGPSNFANILSQRARMEGFIVLDYFNRAGEAMAALGKWYAEGKIHYQVDIVEGFEAIPEAVNRLFTGANTGKLIVRLSKEPVREVQA
ncbi:MAG: NADP-dependent oxidoreductase [Chloroflexi bacterium AL-W]|nr:NADP-dependent oxidoreductase [Chloroflexi bacterium AL-N1]NOK66815.1 NADP-dependent oxidoreductase [Chloroflexi bacterium AL-N10]NOK74893.1 NADP-dependent oxidoreductase [Chloroflexi bacterium AL-N5]NOK81418.1 NADP-dependent oxidoreductase [Chloroflexi bacterium AL-W]NOK88887.1 NADP-dependent oxidoreductase [Chloroflexi bacterium AL-N15]